MKALKILLPIVLSGCFTINFASAQTWTQTSAPSNRWVCIASSADGSLLAAGSSGSGIYISTNSGAAWSLSSAPSNYWYSIAASADGTKLLAAAAYLSSAYPGGIFTSTNSGATWISNNLPNEVWNSVASSADGSKLIVVAPQSPSGFGSGTVFTSTNSGADWVSNNVHGVYVASSADGTKFVLVGSPEVWCSTNFGISWSQDTSAPFVSSIVYPAQCIASSADGNKLVLTLIEDTNNNPGQIYVSTNAGDTWELTSAPRKYWQAVTSSADGKVLLAASGLGSPGPIYVSADAGATWTSNNSPNQMWGALAAAADGGKLVAAAFSDTNYNGSYIFTTQSIPPPWMSIAPSNGGLALSWLVPSTNFVLQQSTDLFSWSDLTNQPILNLTNLQEEVSLPLSGSNVFFRLNTR